VLFLRAAGGKIAFLREYFDPARAAKALDTPILGLESWGQAATGRRFRRSANTKRCQKRKSCEATFLL